MILRVAFTTFSYKNNPRKTAFSEGDNGNSFASGGEMDVELGEGEG